MRQQVILFLVLVLASYPVSLFFTQFLNVAPLANILGFLALLSYLATLLPSILRVVWPNTKKSKILIWLLKYRRHLGVTAFSFGLNHGVLLIRQKNLNLLELSTYLKYSQGFLILLIVTLLAITSNDQTVSNLKKNWKKIHQLTYVVIFILPLHILWQMSNHWTYLTLVEILLTFATIILFSVRKYMEASKTNFIRSR